MLNINLFIKELILFASTQILGFLVAIKSSYSVNNEFIEIRKFSLIDFIFLFIFILLFIYFTVRFSKKSTVFYKIIFVLTIVFGSQVVFSLFFNILISITLSILFVFILFKTKIVFIHNLALILSIAGIGAVFGLSITPINALIILLTLSFYDIIAVYKTGHMIKVAKQMIEAKTVFGIVLPQQKGGWIENLNQVKPGDQFMILGSGDLVMPLILITSVVKSLSILSGIIVMIFSFIGLFLTHYLFVTQKKRAPMAALPPIAVLSIIGYLISVLIL